jgi:hypothetical protein
MLVGWIALVCWKMLAFSTTTSTVTRLEKFNHGSGKHDQQTKMKHIHISLRDGAVPLILFIVLMKCFAMENFANFVGSTAIFGSLILLFGGEGDRRYVAKKFAAYHFLALILCACVDVSPKNSNSLAICAAAFGILTAAYPLSGWIDSFAMRSQSQFFCTWLIAMRPIIVWFFLASMGATVLPRGDSAISVIFTVFTWASLGFVPILFFAKTELRRLVGRITCWQSGYIWLFARNFAPEDFDLVTNLAITQGILIAIIYQAMDSLCGGDNCNSMENVKGLFEENYTLAGLLTSSLSLLIIAPIIFTFKRNMPHLPNVVIPQLLGSMILPLAFDFKIYRLMKNRKPQGSARGTQS